MFGALEARGDWVGVIEGGAEQLDIRASCRYCPIVLDVLSLIKGSPLMTSAQGVLSGNGVVGGGRSFLVSASA